MDNRFAGLDVAGTPSVLQARSPGHKLLSFVAGQLTGGSNAQSQSESDAAIAQRIQDELKQAGLSNDMNNMNMANKPPPPPGAPWGLLVSSRDSPGVLLGPPGGIPESSPGLPGDLPGSPGSLLGTTWDLQGGLEPRRLLSLTQLVERKARPGSAARAREGPSRVRHTLLQGS